MRLPARAGIIGESDGRSKTRVRRVHTLRVAKMLTLPATPSPTTTPDPLAANRE